MELFDSEHLRIPGSASLWGNNQAAARQREAALRRRGRRHGRHHREDRTMRGPRTYLFVFLGLP